MVVSPHADDAELGCGGYIHRIAIRGGAVLHVVVAVGDVYFDHLGRTVTAAERCFELDASMARLGAASQVLYRDKDRVLDTLPLAEVVERIEHQIARFQPSEILIPLPSSHQDHEVVYRACVAACRPSSQTAFVELIAAYEYTASSWGAGSAADAGKGGLYAEVGEDDLEAKLEALRCYQTQIRDQGHCWSIEAALALAKMRGLECGLRFAELFHVMRKVDRRCAS